MINCIHCKKEQQASTKPGEEITQICAHCHRRTPTYREQEYRFRHEIAETRFPLIATARAAVLSEVVYVSAKAPAGQRLEETATYAVDRKLDKFTRGKKVRYQNSTMVHYRRVAGRFHNGHTDSSVAAAIAVYKNENRIPQYSIFVVFRGSHIRASSDGKNANVDWRANFDNQMRETEYAANTIRVHQGFYNSVRSYRDKIHRELNEIKADYHNSNLVVTGHSQGAAHATLFCHWLSYKDKLYTPVLIGFSSPRCGNFNFAQDMWKRIGRRQATLPFDGSTQKSSFIVYLQHDPVVSSMRNAFKGENTRHTHKSADDMLSGRMLDLVRAAKYAEESETQRPVESDIYFHIKQLVELNPNALSNAGYFAAQNHQMGNVRERVISHLR